MSKKYTNVNQEALESLTGLKVTTNGSSTNSYEPKHRDKLLNFIGKYHFAQDSVIWEIKGGKLMTRFKSDDQSILGEVVMKDFNIPHNIKSDLQIGIYETDKLKKVLNILDNNIQISLKSIKVENETRYPNLKIDDENTTVSFTLADPEAIPYVPQPQELPDFEVEFEIDEDFSSKFVKSYNALTPLYKSFSVHTKDDRVEIFIGYSQNINQTNVSIIPTHSKISKKIKPVSFMSSFFKNSILANREFKTAKLKVSEKGLAHIQFENAEFLADYYHVAQDAQG